MQITIQNKQLKLTVDTLGAQMMSFKTASGREYLWQGDPAYWTGRAPTLFPFIGRLMDGKYSYDGKEYPMGGHGFAKISEFSVAEQGSDRLVLELSATKELMERYPFDFTFRVIYQLRENTLDVTYSVDNHGQNTMYFAVGGHPGFRVPFAEGERFEDYRMEFSQECHPDRILFGSHVLVSGEEQYALEENRILPLRHDLFDDDAIILKNMAREVTLKSMTSGSSVRVSYPDMPYVGFWHKPKTDAPYVCIEPWSSLTGREDVVEDISCRSDFLHLEPGKHYENTWAVTITE